MANKKNHRRFGNVRKLPSGRYQASYLGPDGQRRNAPETFERKTDADRFLVLTEAQMARGEWTDPERSKLTLADYAETWISQRPGLRPRTVELYRWLLGRHITPHLGGVPLGKLTTHMIREWRSKLLASGVSESMAARAYLLLRAVLMTAVDEDKILPANPCRVKGAGTINAAERPVLTVAQVFELADRVGTKPVGNVHRRADGYRLRYRAAHGVMRPFPEPFPSRAAAQRELWRLVWDGKADSTKDSRFRALVLLAAFASLRWGEVSALRRCDIDVDACTVRVRAAYVELANGRMLLGPPKSKAGLRTVSIPAAIISDVVAHLAKYTRPEPDALVFTGVKGGPLRRGGFVKLSGWAHVVESLGLAGVHFHDLRHTGNTLAADMGVSLKNLMARMGHDSERAALVYQHKSIAADRKIADGLDRLVRAERGDDDTDDDGLAGVAVPVA